MTSGSAPDATAVPLGAPEGPRDAGAVPRGPSASSCGAASKGGPANSGADPRAPKGRGAVFDLRLRRGVRQAPTGPAVKEPHTQRERQLNVASVSFHVADGRMTVGGLRRVGLVVAADVGRLALDRDQLVDDRLLLRGERLGERGERLRELRVVGLLRQLLRPVQGQVEVAAAVVDAAERGSATCPR